MPLTTPPSWPTPQFILIPVTDGPDGKTFYDLYNLQGFDTISEVRAHMNATPQFFITLRRTEGHHYTEFDPAANQFLN